MNSDESSSQYQGFSEDIGAANVLPPPPGQTIQFAEPDYFRVFLGTGGANHRVFANDAQRIRIVIHIRKLVRLTGDSDWRSRPLTRAEEQSLTLLGVNSTFPSGWTVHSGPGEFQQAGSQAPDIVSATDSESLDRSIPQPPVGVQVFELFLSTSSVGSPVEWMARVTLDAPTSESNSNVKHYSRNGTVTTVGIQSVVVPASELEHQRTVIWDDKSIQHSVYIGLVTELFRFRPSAPLMMNSDGSRTRTGPPLSIAGGRIQPISTTQPRPNFFSTFYRHGRRIFDLIVDHNRTHFAHADITAGYPHTPGPDWHYTVPTGWNIRAQIYYHGRAGDGRFDPPRDAPIIVTFQDIFGTLHRYRIRGIGNDMQISNYD